MNLEKKHLKWAGIAVLAIWLIAEIGVRFLGWVDFPVYQTDPDIGYYLKPSQHGRFENKNEWKVNEEGFLADKFLPGKKKDVLLIGDSIVLGGNPIDHSMRLGTLLQKESGDAWSVWPAAAGGWSVMNEIAFLQKKDKSLEQIDWLVWVLNSGDFIGPSPWETDRLHPRHHPWFATWYLFDKHVLGEYIEPNISWMRHISSNPGVSSQPTDFAFDSWDDYYQKFKSRHSRVKRAIIWYPDRSEEDQVLPFWESLTARVKSYAEQESMVFINVRDDSRWSVEYYRDQIHPTAEGNAVLAKIIEEKLEPYIGKK